MSNTLQRRTGFHVWTYGTRSWHRTLAGAERAAARASRWCSDVHIIDIQTGERV